MTADRARVDWAAVDWAAVDWARIDWARVDWARVDWAAVGGGSDWARELPLASGPAAVWPAELAFGPASTIAAGSVTGPPVPAQPCRRHVVTGRCTPCRVAEFAAADPGHRLRHQRADPRPALEGAVRRDLAGVPVLVPESGGCGTAGSRRGHRHAGPAHAGVAAHLPSAGRTDRRRRGRGSDVDDVEHAGVPAVLLAGRCHRAGAGFVPEL